MVTLCIQFLASWPLGNTPPLRSLSTPFSLPPWPLCPCLVFRHLEALADWRAILGGLGIGVLCCILPYLLYTEGLRYTEAGKAAILATVEPFVAALLGICLFHESVTFYKLLGMGAIFLAILLLNRTTNE